MKCQERVAALVARPVNAGRGRRVKVVDMGGQLRRRDVAPVTAPTARLHLRRHVDLVRVASALCSV